METLKKKKLTLLLIALMLIFSVTLFACGEPTDHLRQNSPFRLTQTAAVQLLKVNVSTLSVSVYFAYKVKLSTIIELLKS